MTVVEWFQVVTESVTAIASILLAGGIFIAGRQLKESKRNAQARFEDSMTMQYRQIVSRIPLNAMLGKELSPFELEDNLRTFYGYFDLTNEQVFLKTNDRISKETWANWLNGIENNLDRPAFRQAWQRIAPDLNGSFDDLIAEFPSRLGETSSPLALLVSE